MTLPCVWYDADAAHAGCGAPATWLVGVYAGGADNGSVPCCDRHAPTVWIALGRGMTLIEPGQPVRFSGHLHDSPTEVAR